MAGIISPTEARGHRQRGDHPASRARTSGSASGRSSPQGDTIILWCASTDRLRCAIVCGVVVTLDDAVDVSTASTVEAGDLPPDYDPSRLREQPAG